MVKIGWGLPWLSLYSMSPTRAQEQCRGHVGQFAGSIVCCCSLGTIVSWSYHLIDLFAKVLIQNVSNAHKTGIFTIGVSAFALVPLQALTDTLTSAKLIVSQALRVLTGGYSPGIIKLMGQQLYRLLRPRKFGLVEFVAFPGFFTTACEEFCLSLRPQRLSQYLAFSHPTGRKEVPHLYG
jgi:hypothetical protein